jgi:hypothetical protein
MPESHDGVTPIQLLLVVLQALTTASDANDTNAQVAEAFCRDVITEGSPLHVLTLEGGYAAYAALEQMGVEDIVRMAYRINRVAEMLAILAALVGRSAGERIAMEISSAGETPP